MSAKPLADPSNSAIERVNRLGQLPLVASEPNAPMSLALAEICERLEAIVGGYRPREAPADRAIEGRFRQHRLFL